MSQELADNIVVKQKEFRISEINVGSKINIGDLEKLHIS